jgi:hypothetical protein
MVQDLSALFDGAAISQRAHIRGSASGGYYEFIP